MERSGQGRWAAQQLALRVRRQRLAIRRTNQTILLPHVSRRAARSQLAQSRGAQRDLRRHALLAQARRRRLPCRRDLAPDQGRPVPRQSARSEFRAGGEAKACPHPALHRGPARGARRDRGDAPRGRRVSRPAADRRNLPADRTARRLLRARSDRSAPAVQLRAARRAVAGARDREADRGIRAAAAAGRLAQLGAGKSCPAAHRAPWLPLEGVYRQRNVAALERDEGSIYQLHRRLIALRRRHAALQVGSYRPLADEGDLLIFIRETDSEKILVALNMGSRPAAVNLPRDNREGCLLLSSFCDRADKRVAGAIDLRGNEGVIVEL